MENMERERYGYSTKRDERVLWWGRWDAPAPAPVISGEDDSLWLDLSDKLTVRLT